MFYGFALVVLTTACAQSPTARLFSLAENHGLLSYHLIAEGQKLLVLESHPSPKRAQSTMRVYLEGDGIPWVLGQLPAANPTSTSLLALRLMIRDPKPAIYLNRPCYGHEVLPEQCDEKSWTSGRYSTAIVNSMSTALDTLKTMKNAKKIVLIGHSGGGSIATLLAAKRDDVIGLVTLAANLDHRSWTDFFGFLPLEDSLNAKDFLPLPPYIRRWHHIAKQDQRVPYAIANKTASLDTGASIIVHPQFNHTCCWLNLWPATLESMGL